MCPKWDTYIDMATAKIHARIEEPLKKEGERILKELGMTTTELVRMTFRQLVMRKGLPFDVKIPNEETLKAFEETEKDPEKLTAYPSVEEAMSDLWK